MPNPRKRKTVRSEPAPDSAVVAKAARAKSAPPSDLLVAPGEEERSVSVNLRPRRFQDCIGQQQVIEALQIAIQAAKQRSEPVDHILLHGPPGLGKTTLAHIIAEEMGGHIVSTTGPALERGGDLVAILTNLERCDILFIDEVHRLPRTVEELLYPAMEDFVVDVVFDKGTHARTFRCPLQPFTLAGATTRAGLVSSPLRQRFGIMRELHFYQEEELFQAVTRSAKILETPIQPAAAREIARRSRGTIRIANRLLRRVRDYAQVRGKGAITREITDAALRLEGVDELGLTSLDRRLLLTIIESHDGGPVGIEALAATLQEETQTLEDMVEPFLLNLGFLSRTPGGRKATGKAFEHFGKTTPSGANSLAQEPPERQKPLW